MTRNETTGPNWNALGLRLSVLTARIKVSAPRTPREKVFAQALEQLVEETRELVTSAYHSEQIASHKGINAYNEAGLRNQLKQARKERHVTVTEFRQELAEQLRKCVNPWSFPSRYRREGATTVVDWIDPGNPATPPPVARFSDTDDQPPNPAGSRSASAFANHPVSARDPRSATTHTPGSEGHADAS